MQKPHLIIGVGELLWDMLPAGPRLGGAPANFAVMAGQLGNHAAILSRIGRDHFGQEAIHRLEPMPVDESFIQIDPAHETGRVTVALEAGEPHYTIHEPAAWDSLELADEWVALAERTDAFCFGTLAQRSPRSRQTIQTLAAETSSACVRIFDVNLRAPFYSAEIVEESLELANVLKMNAAETPLVLDLLGLANQDATGEVQPTNAYLRASSERLLQAFPSLRMVAVTRGSQGSLLSTRDEWSEHAGFPIIVRDSIGAGDAFTAALAHYMLRGANLATLNEAGNRWGSWMASQSGAMPSLPEDILNAISSAIDT